MWQWKKLLATFSTGQRLTLLLAAVAVAAGLFAFTKWKREGDFRPLYTELEPDDAGAVIARLKEDGVDYRLSGDGRTVLVPSAAVAASRLSMATAGLPRNGRIGFELFDRTNLGATEFSEHINYGRALEGELERSVMCLSEVERARVHLTFPKDSVFLESRQPAKASVMLKLKPGGRLDSQNVLAVCHLVASAVQGLAPEAVSVLDMNGNLLNRPRKSLLADGSEPADGMIEYRQSLEKDLLVKINGTLGPLLGPEKFRASVSLDCDFSSGEQSEETFDPTRSVMVTSQKTEDVSGTAASAGVPGTASNLPRPTSRPGGTQAGISRRTENIAYQSSRVVRRIRLPQGTVRRLSVAVLVDHNVRWEGSGAQARRLLEAPPPERLKSIHDLVAGVTGFTADRGDQLIVESLPFESTLNTERLSPGAEPKPTPSPTPAPWFEKVLENRRLWIIAAVGAGVLLLFGLLAALLARKRRRRAVEFAAPPELPPAEHVGTSGQKSVPSAREAETQVKAREANRHELQPVQPTRADVLVGHLRGMIKEDPVASTQVLRSWLTSEEE